MSQAYEQWSIRKDKRALRAKVAIVNLKLFTGAISSGIQQLHAVLKEAQQDPEYSLLIPLIQRNLIRAHFHRWRQLVNQGHYHMSWNSLNQAFERLGELPEKEQLVLKAVTAFEAVASRKMLLAARIAQGLDKQINSVMTSSYKKIGAELLLAFIDYFSQTTSRNPATVTKLEQFSSKMSVGSRKHLFHYISRGYFQVAEHYYTKRQLEKMRRSINKARRFVTTLSANQRHNIAVADYYTGKQATSITRLQGLTEPVPFANCNLAIHYEGLGRHKKAYDLLKTCAKRRIFFPGLKEILNFKSQIFGP